LIIAQAGLLFLVDLGGLGDNFRLDAGLLLHSASSTQPAAEDQREVRH
jgi:hypothetical protein